MSIRYREKYKTWQVYWNNPVTGKRESKSFKTEKEAKKENDLINYRLQHEPESFQKKEEKPEEEKVTTFNDIYFLFLKGHSFSKKETCNHLFFMRPALESIGNQPIETFTQKDFQSLITLYKNTMKSPASVHGGLASVRSVFYFAMRNEYMPEMHWPPIPGSNYKRFVPPSPEELERMFKSVAPHIQRVLILGAYMGVRVGCSELFKLTWDDVDIIQMIIRIHGSRKNPNAPWREVPIRESLVEVFKQWKEEDEKNGYKYLINVKGKQVGSIKTAWTSMLRRAGITRRIRPYDLRHAFGTELVAAGVDVGTVAKLMGHSNPSMLLKHYQYVMDAQKRKAVEMLPSTAYVPRSCAATQKPKNC